jgi:hypothetical protein
MSRKIVQFSLPPGHGGNPAEAQPELRLATPGQDTREPEAATDNWVHNARETVETRLAGQPQAEERSPLLIDLTKPRSLPELIQLIWAFPMIATSCWMAQATESWLEIIRRQRV